MRETRTWEQMRRDNIGAAWIEPSGEFCTRYSRTSISDKVNALLDEQRAAGFEEWQLVGFNGCWSCDRCIECHFAKFNIGRHENMKKIIAKEVNPSHVDFSFYFDDDGLKGADGENYTVYIVPADRKRYFGFNMDKYEYIEGQADSIIDGFYDVSNKWTNIYANYKEVMEDNGIPYTSRKCHLLKEWAKYANPYDTSYIAEFLTITTGEEWAVKAFRGYSQGDYCEVVYCVNHYTPEHINEIGKFWLGCGTEFSINDCCGYYVPDNIRWQEGEILRKYLADSYGCKPEELEIYLYDDEHVVTNYRLMD